MFSAFNYCMPVFAMICQFPDLRPIVVTNCTTRKRAPHPPVLLSAETGCESLSELAVRWNVLLRDARWRTVAGDLYVGRAIAESKCVSRLLGADLYIVSAGLGLVRETTLVPNYNLTVSGSDGPLKDALKTSGENSTVWWTTLTRRAESAGSLCDLICTQPDRLVLIALPATYLEMVGDDLSTIDRNAARMIRIFTSEAGRAKLPGHLLQCALPYDERLESLVGYDGTRAEFPQRALRHFVEVLGGHHLALAHAHVVTTMALAGLKKRTTPPRRRVTDAQIASMLREQWTFYSGNSARLHRYLRDTALVACEQSRFQLLWRKVQAENRSQETNAYDA